MKDWSSYERFNFHWRWICNQDTALPHVSLKPSGVLFVDVYYTITRIFFLRQILFSYISKVNKTRNYIFIVGLIYYPKLLLLCIVVKLLLAIVPKKIHIKLIIVFYYSITIKKLLRSNFDLLGKGEEMNCYHQFLPGLVCGSKLQTRTKKHSRNNELMSKIFVVQTWTNHDKHPKLDNDYSNWVLLKQYEGIKPLLI